MFEKYYRNSSPCFNVAFLWLPSFGHVTRRMSSVSAVFVVKINGEPMIAKRARKGAWTSTLKETRREAILVHPMRGLLGADLAFPFVLTVCGLAGSLVPRKLQVPQGDLRTRISVL